MHRSAKKVPVFFLCLAALLAGCGGKDDLAPAPVADTTPAQFTFVDQGSVPVSTEKTSAAVTITGIDSPSAVTVSGGTYSVGCTATYISTGSTINNGQTVCVRHISAATASTAVNTTLTIGGVADIFTSTTAAPVGADTTPAAFNFTDQTGVAGSTVITSAAVTITGIDSPSAVTVTGGTYSVDCTATYIDTGSTINNNQTVCVRHTSSAAASTATDTVLTVGGVSDTFTSTTTAVVADTTPAQFNFTDQTSVPAASERTSAAVTITGIDSPSAVTVSGGTYSIDCTATYISTGSTINNNQTVCVRHTSSAAASTATDTVLTIGGVSDTFTSTTASATPVVSLLPFLTGAGELRLLDPTAVISGTNPKTVDTGLAPPPLGTGCNDCFEQAESYFTGTVTGTTVSNLHLARLAYVKRASGDNAGGAVFKLDLAQGAVNTPVQISSLANACEIVRTETNDFLNIDNSAVVIETAGADTFCGVRGAFPADPQIADNVVTVIRLNSLITDAGTNIRLARGAGNPIHAQTNASGVITGYVSFEVSGTDLAPVFELVHRNASLVADLAPLLTLEASGGVDTTGANLQQSNLTHLFVTAIPDNQGLSLFRIEGNGTLSPMLHSFAGFNAGNPIQEGLNDGTNLYFSDASQLLRIPMGSTTTNAEMITTLVHPDPLQTLRIVGNRALDTSTSPDRVVFDAQDDGLTAASGVFSVETTASNVTATTLKNYPAPLPPDFEAGSSAMLVLVANGRAYINVTNHGATPEDALIISTDGTNPTLISGAYWAGSNAVTSFDLAQVSALPTEFIFLARHADLESDGTFVDTLSVVNPATGLEGIVLGTVADTGDFQAVRINGLGRFALARAEIDRGARDNDVYFLDAQTAGSLTPLAATGPNNDIPLDN